MLRATQDGGHVIVLAQTAADDGLLHSLDGMIRQELQNADVVAGARARAMLLFQGAAQLGKHRRQLPVAVNVGVVQRRRFARERHQVVQRIQHLLIVPVRAAVLGDDLAPRDDRDVPHVGLDGHTLKGIDARHAVLVAIETHRLVLVHAGRLFQTGVERPRRQRQGMGLFALEALADRLVLAGLLALAFAQTAGAQVGVELFKVLDPRYRRRPNLLQELHAPFGTWLLLRPTHQAEERLKVVVARQRRVTPVELPRTALEQVGRDGFGIVPPDLTGHATEEPEGLDQAVQDRLGPLRGQSQHERAIRVGPGRDQHRNLPAAVGEVDVNVPEVGFQALARVVSERDERLPVLATLGADIVPQPLIAALVAVFGL